MSFPVWLRAISAQTGGVLVAYLVARTFASLSLEFALEAIVAVQSAVAVLLSWVMRLPSWWLPVQALFVPALLLVLSVHAPPLVFLACFILLWLTFRHAVGVRVPLYLSNRTTWQALRELLPERPGIRFIDLGCGLGGGLAHLAASRPDGFFCGVESAPLPWLVSRLRVAAGKKNAVVRYGDIWAVDLGDYDVVYAFLSPEPMPQLWKKASAEMRPGTLFISNSFEIPHSPPNRTLVLGDGRQTRLLVWQM